VTRRARRLLLAFLLAPVAAVLAAVGLGAFVLSAPRFRGPVSDHFDGRRFFNPGVPPKEGGFWTWMLSRDRGPWPDWIEEPTGPPPPARVGAGEMRVTFVNHSTVLLQVDGTNVLTDPVWSRRVGPWNAVGPRRHRAPGIRFEDLPPLDAVLVSHNHYDHMDLPTLRRLSAERPCPVLVPLGNRAFLEGKGVARVEDLDWWDERSLPGGVRVVCVPARHFSNRGLRDRDATLWAGYVVEGPSGRALFAGDTGDGPHVEAIAARFAPVRLACLPIGAFRPRWFMSPVHLDPTEAVDVARRLRAGTSVGIHFGTFAQADDGEREPVERLAEALASSGGDGPRFWTLRHGEGRDVPPLDAR
jgi:L-ascorbate metabolism protein UlaG (beta-lactamase superfamily)